MTSPLIHLRSLSVKYCEQWALKNIQGQINRGSLVAILGPNGGGKSSFLKTLAGVLKPTIGSYHFENLPPTKIAYLPQHVEIDRSFPLTVYEVVAMGLMQRHGFFKSLTGEWEQRVQEALSQVGLSQQANRPLHALSGGQLQRVLFARLAAQQAELILLDEPFAAIDHATIEDLMQLILLWHAQGKTILLVTHDFEVVKTYVSETMLLAKEMIAWGLTAEVLTKEHLQKAKSLSYHWENRLDLSSEFMTTLKS